MAVYSNRSQEKAERLVKLRDYLYANASPTHAVKIADILAYLESERYEVEIKTVYSDLKTLEIHFGLDIQYDGRQRGYLLLNPPFEPYELRSIVNSIQAAKFITQQEADSLTQKIMRLADKYTRPSLNRRTYVPNRVRAVNTEAMRGLDIVYEAIAQDRKISYKRFEYNKSKTDRREIFTVSPYSVIWEDDTFYVYALQKKQEERIVVEYPPDIEKSDIMQIEAMEDDEYWDNIEERGYERREVIPDTYTYMGLNLDIRHMEQIKILTDRREGKDFAQKHLEDGKRTTALQMSCEKTKLKVSNEYLTEIIDKFGSDATISPIDDKFSVVTINEAPTPELYMWTREFYPFMEITFPEGTEDRMRAYFAVLSKDNKLVEQIPIFYFFQDTIELALMLIEDYERAMSIEDSLENQ